MNTKKNGQMESLLKFQKHLVAGAIALFLLLPWTARGGGVVTNCTEAELRAAMAGGGTVTFACDGTITLTSTITNDLELTLDGSGHQIAISGGGGVRIFLVRSNATTLLNLALVNGFSRVGSAILNSGGTVNLSGITLSNHVASSAASDEGYLGSSMGGAVRNLSGGFAATNCDFIGNAARGLTPMARGSGGALYGGGQVILERCRFSGNQALGGPSLYLQAPGNDATGGAIHNDGQLVANACTFANNSATGGAAYIGMGYGSPGGSAMGGALYNAGTLVLSGSTIANNTAYGASGGPGYTGGVFHDQGLPGGNGNSGGRGDAGALYNAGTASLINCTIAWNAGIGGGGGQGGQGGSGYNWGGPGGTGGTGGNGFGGVDGTCNLTNCTLALNQGVPGSHGSGGPGGTGRLGNGGTGLPGSSGIAWGGTTCSTLVNTLIASNSPAGNDSFPDPKLGPLADNGGPTWTMALLPGSPAIDAGDNAASPPTDQRGFPRPAGLASDIGAFEFGAQPLVLAISGSGATGLNIVVTGNTNQWCRLLTSTNLADWQCVATNQIGADGTVVFQDNCGTGEARRFYRVVLP